MTIKGCGCLKRDMRNAVKISSLEETIRQQQSTIDRLTEQRDSLLKAVNIILKAMNLCNTEMVYQAEYELQALIAEIEAGK